MFKKISPKQALAYVWWRLPEYKDYHIFVAHGAIRTGKTVFATWGYFDWAEETVMSTPNEKITQGWNKFNIIAASGFTAKDNVVEPLIDYATSKKGYIEVNRRDKLNSFPKTIYTNGSNGVVTFKNKNRYFMFKYVGFNNKRSIRSIQGSTRRGTFIDEAALIDNELIEQAIGRNITFGDHRVFMTCNPEGDDSHSFYQQYIKGGNKKGVVVIQYELLDNPIFSQEEVDRLSRIFTPVMYERKVLGKWVRDSGAIYKKFETARHVDKFYATFDEYQELRVGIDYGEKDATVFTLIGIQKRFNGLDVIDTYYHKNSDTSERDINDYTDDFFEWIERHKDKYRMRITVYVESASNGVTFYKVLKRRAGELNVQYLNFRLVDKSKRIHTSKSAIKERIDALNVMLGADFIRIEAQCNELVLAIKKAVWKDDKEERLDDHTVDIDSLDSLEYAFVGLIPKILERIEFLRR